MSKAKEPLKPQNVIAWLGSDRVKRIGASAEQVADVCRRAPDVPTAGIWLLQGCQVQPSEDDLQKWSEDVLTLSKSIKAAKTAPPSTP